MEVQVDARASESCLGAQRSRQGEGSQSECQGAAFQRVVGSESQFRSGRIRV